MLSGVDAGGKGTLVQAARKAPMAIIEALRHDSLDDFKPVAALQEKIMVLLLLEALGALLLLVFIVWWTMFSGRDKGELKNEAADREKEEEEKEREKQ